MQTFLSLFSWAGIVDFVMFLLKPLLLLLICKIAINLLMKLSTGLIGKTHLDAGVKGFLKSAVHIALWCVAVILIADAVGINTASLVTVLGVVSLALSMAFQGILTNVFSGINILITKPFVVCDYVDIAGMSGTVTGISLMRTTLVTPDNKTELIPNGDVCAKNITNYSHEPLRRVDLKVNVSYETPTCAVQDAVLEVVNADKRVYQDAEHAPFVRLSNYNANDIEYTIRVWVDGACYWDVYFDTLENIRESFAKHNVAFSYPHTVVHLEK